MHNLSLNSRPFPIREMLPKYANVLLIAVLIWEYKSQTITDTQNILSSILTGYSTDVRPATNQSLPVKVNISMELVALQEFNEISEYLTVVIILYLTWSDSRLAWDPSLYNHTKFVTIPSRKIWTPNLIITSPVGNINPVGNGQDWMVVRCSHDGEIFWSPADILSSSCNVDLRYYPFDTQMCTLTFIPWGYLAKEVELVSAEDKILRSFFTENGEWEVIDSNITTGNLAGGFFHLFGVSLQIVRRPRYFTLNVVLPIVFISFLNVLVFYIPVESGERVSFAITVFLALAVFMTIVGDTIPKNSKQMANICYFLLSIVGQSTLVCCENIVCLITYYRRGPVPKCLVILLCRHTCVREKRSNMSPGNDNYEHYRKEMDLISDTRAEFNCQNEDDDNIEHDVSHVTWRDVSHVLDTVFGLSSLVILLLFVVCFIVLIVMEGMNI